MTSPARRAVLACLRRSQCHRLCSCNRSSNPFPQHGTGESMSGSSVRGRVSGVSACPWLNEAQSCEPRSRRAEAGMLCPRRCLPLSWILQAQPCSPCCHHVGHPSSRGPSRAGSSLPSETAVPVFLGLSAFRFMQPWPWPVACGRER